MTKTTETALMPTVPDMGASIQRLAVEGSRWLTEHYVELIFAVVIGTAIFFLLGAVKRLGSRYVRNNSGLTGYRTIIGTAISRTSKFFMLMVSAELVVSFGSAPPSFERVVHVLFTIAMVLQVAIWLREIILGLIVRKTSQDPDQHETLENAMTLIRLLVTFVVFAIAAIMILDNLGVNVTGLIAENRTEKYAAKGYYRRRNHHFQHQFAGQGNRQHDPPGETANALWHWCNLPDQSGRGAPDSGSSQKDSRSQ